MRLLYLLSTLFILRAHAQSYQEIANSIDTLKSLGVVGIEHLCHPTEDLLPVPTCTSLSELFLDVGPVKQKPGIRGSGETKRKLQEDENHDAEFYIINVGGTVVR
jgi:hypothetical protein